MSRFKEISRKGTASPSIIVKLGILLIVAILASASLVVMMGGNDDRDGRSNTILDVEPLTKEQLEGTTDMTVMMIENIEDVKTMRSMVLRGDSKDLYFALGSDIQFPSTNFSPIGGIDHGFEGVFDGNGYTIYGLTIDDSGRYTGLFAYAHDAAFKNVALEGGQIEVTTYSTEMAYVGSLVGHLDSSTGASVMNCYSTVNIKVNGENVSIGGLIGSTTGSVSIADCYNGGSVRSHNPNGAVQAGGIIGSATVDRLTVTDCYNTGSMEATSGNRSILGGILGYLRGSIIMDGSFNTGDLSSQAGSAYSNMGGLIGYARGDAEIDDCHNSGSIKGNHYVQAGGLVGYILILGDLIMTDSYNDGDLIFRVEGEDHQYFVVGGLLGQIMGSNDVSMIDCHNSGTMEVKGGVRGIYCDVGGLVAVLSTEGLILNDSYNTGEIDVQVLGNNSKVYVGGLMGECRAWYSLSIKDSYNTARTSALVSGYGNTCIVGGLSGSMDPMRGEVAVSFNKGDVRSTYDAGGLFGLILGQGSMRITDAYNIGDVTSMLGYAGGIIGTHISTPISVKNVYNAGESYNSDHGRFGSGLIASSDQISNISVMNSFFRILSGDGSDGSKNMDRTYGGEPKYDFDLKDQRMFERAGWDFSNAGPWAIDSDTGKINEGYPYFGHLTNTFTLKITSGPGGSVFPSGAKKVELGDSMDVFFLPGAGKVIDDVLVDGVSVPGAISAGRYVFKNVNGDHTLHVTFTSSEATSNNIVRTFSDEHSNISPNGMFTVNHGDSIRFMFKADEGYVISQVSIDGVNRPDLVYLDSYTFENVRTNHIISVRSSELTDEVTFNVNIIEGKGHVEYRVDDREFTTYTIPMTVAVGSNISFRAVADNRYSFDRWEGQVISTEPMISIDHVRASGTLDVYFVENEYDHLLFICVGVAFLLMFFIVLCFVRRFDVEISSENINTGSIGRKAYWRRKYVFTVDGASSVRYMVGDAGEWTSITKGADGSYMIPGRDVIGDMVIEVK